MTFPKADHDRLVEDALQWMARQDFTSDETVQVLMMTTWRFRLTWKQSQGLYDRWCEETGGEPYRPSYWLADRYPNG